MFALFFLTLLSSSLKEFIDILIEFFPFFTSFKIKKQGNVWWNMPSS